MAHDFTLDDFRKQFEQIAKRGTNDSVRRLLGMGEMIPEGDDSGAALACVQRMIEAMTPEERRDPDRIDETARHRIAASSGTRPDEVEQLLAQFTQVRNLMRHLANMSFWQRIKLVLGFGKLPRQDGET